MLFRPKHLPDHARAADVTPVMDCAWVMPLSLGLVHGHMQLLCVAHGFDTRRVQFGWAGRLGIAWHGMGCPTPPAPAAAVSAGTWNPPRCAGSLHRFAARRRDPPGFTWMVPPTASAASKAPAVGAGGADPALYSQEGPRHSSGKRTQCSAPACMQRPAMCHASQLWNFSLPTPRLPCGGGFVVYDVGRLPRNL